MRRAGVGPWIATAAAASFVLFGPGEQNIIWAFQIGFTGSLTFGLAQLVLVDHDGPVDERDAFAVAAGTLSLLSSGVGIAMAVVAGIATLGRRGWKVAMLQTAPLAAMYVAWWLVERPQLTSPFGRPTIRVVFDWVRSGEIGIFLALGHWQIVAALLAVVFVIGLVLAWSRLSLSELRRHASIPTAMLIGGVVFSTFSALGRWFLGSEFARSSRYVHIGTALVLPALAIAIDAIARHWRVIGIVAVALLLVAIPWNSTHFGRDSTFGEGYMNSRRRIITNVVRLPEAKKVPRDVRPIPDVFVGSGLTIGFLLDAVKTGKLDPPSGPIPPELEEELRLRLGVAQRQEGQPVRCRQVTGPLNLRPAKGAEYGITTPVTMFAHRAAAPDITSDQLQPERRSHAHHRAARPRPPLDPGPRRFVLHAVLDRIATSRGMPSSTTAGRGLRRTPVGCCLSVGWAVHHEQVVQPELKLLRRDDDEAGPPKRIEDLRRSEAVVLSGLHPVHHAQPDRNVEDPIDLR